MRDTAVSRPAEDAAVTRARIPKEAAVRWLLVLTLLVPGFTVPPAALADPWSGASVALDAVGVQLSRRTLYAFRDARSTADLRLEPREEVVWLGSRGQVAVVLTTKRVLGVTHRAGWRSYRLRSEDGTPIAKLGGRVALVITERRVLSLDGRGGALAVRRLGAGERHLTSDVHEDVAVAVTNRRAFGFAGGRAFRSEVPIRAQERFNSLTVLGRAGTVETSRRFLVFSGLTGQWMDERRALR